MRDAAADGAITPEVEAQVASVERAISVAASLATVYLEAGWTVEDLGSTNGVLLNGRETRGAQPLHGGDRLELGSTEIFFELG